MDSGKRSQLGRALPEGGGGCRIVGSCGIHHPASRDQLINRAAIVAPSQSGKVLERQPIQVVWDFAAKTFDRFGAQIRAIRHV